MRKIEKRGEPKELSQWRAVNRGNPNFGYALIGSELRELLKQQMLEEQGYLCAYTGQRISAVSAHLEHLQPQAHCTLAQEVDYQNLVACYPGPNRPSPGYGAIEKADWPSDEEGHLFVSPLNAQCETRFLFNKRGCIAVSQANDIAASTTIQRLKLVTAALERNRKASLSFIDYLRLKEARTRLIQLEKESGRFTEFSFAVKQVLSKRIKTLQGIRNSKEP